MTTATKEAELDPRQILVDQRTGLLNKQLLQNALKIFGVGAGLGLVGRGAQGMYNLGRRNLGTPTAGQKPIQIGVPGEEEEEKYAGWLGDLFSGGMATNISEHPLSPITGIAAAGTGAVGGWKLMDYILDKQRKKELEGELDMAKEDYEGALQSAHSKAASELGQDLDRLFDLVQEKQATFGGAMSKMTGIGLLGMAPLALASGLVSYSMAGKGRKQKLLDKALAKRRRRMRSHNPTRIYASPMSTGNTMKGGPDEEELEGDPLDKVASHGLLKVAYPPGLGPLDNPNTRAYYRIQKNKADKYHAKRRAERAETSRINRNSALEGAKRRESEGGSLVSDSGAIVGRNSTRGKQMLADRAAAKAKTDEADSYRGLMDQGNQFITQRNALREAGDRAGEQALYQSPAYKQWAKDLKGSSTWASKQTAQPAQVAETPPKKQFRERRPSDVAKRRSAYDTPTQTASATSSPATPATGSKPQGFGSLPQDFQQRYLQRYRAGKTNMTPQQAASYYQKNYAGTGRSLPNAAAASTAGTKKPTPRGASGDTGAKGEAGVAGGGAPLHETLRAEPGVKTTETPTATGGTSIQQDGHLPPGSPGFDAVTSKMQAARLKALKGNPLTPEPTQPAGATQSHTATLTPQTPESHPPLPKEAPVADLPTPPPPTPIAGLGAAAARNSGPMSVMPSPGSTGPATPPPPPNDHGLSKMPLPPQMSEPGQPPMPPPPTPPTPAPAPPVPAPPAPAPPAPRPGGAPGAPPIPPKPTGTAGTPVGDLIASPPPAAALPRPAAPAPPPTPAPAPTIPRQQTVAPTPAKPAVVPHANPTGGVNSPGAVSARAAQTARRNARNTRSGPAQLGAAAARGGVAPKAPKAPAAGGLGGIKGPMKPPGA